MMFILQDDVCEIISLKDMFNVRDGHQIYNVSSRNELDEVTSLLDVQCVSKIVCQHIHFNRICE